MMTFKDRPTLMKSRNFMGAPPRDGAPLGRMLPRSTLGWAAREGTFFGRASRLTMEQRADVFRPAPREILS